MRPKKGIKTYLTAGEQTRLSWARRIDRYEELPEIYRGYIDRARESPGELPYLVLTPTYKGFMRRETEKLACCTEHEVMILERARSGVVATCYAFEGIHFIEVGSILLHAWLTIHGTESSGRVASSTLKFNSVTLRSFAPIIDRVRCASGGIKDDAWQQEVAQFDCLCDLNFKFMNFAKSSVLPGEKVQRWVYQPEIREHAARLLGWSFERKISPPHLLILTDRELILIQDDEQAWKSGMRYGGVWDYIPLSEIRSTSLMEEKDDLIALAFELPQNMRVESLFSASKLGEVEELRQQMIL